VDRDGMRRSRRRIVEHGSQRHGWSYFACEDNIFYQSSRWC